MNEFSGSCPLSPGASVWLYFRDSGGDRQDLSAQKAKVLEYCQQHQLRIDRVFEDAAKTAKTTDGRDEFTAMVDIAQTSKYPPVAGLVCWDMSRFSRNIDDGPYYRRLLERAGLRLIFIANFIPDGIAGRLVATAYDTANALWLEQLSYNAKRGLQQLIANGAARGIPFWSGRVPRCFITGRASTGRTLNDGTEHTAQYLIPDPATWEQGRRAFEMSATGYTYEEIAQGVPLFHEILHGGKGTGKADPMLRAGATSRVGAFLKNQIYKGTLVYAGQEYPNYVEAMVSAELWQAANARRYRRGQSFEPNTHPKAGRGRYLLSSLMFCGECNAAVYGQHTTRTRNEKQYHLYAYRCSSQAYHDRCKMRSLSTRKLDPAIIERVMSELMTPGFFDRLWRSVEEQWRNEDGLLAEIAKTETEVRDYKQRIANLREKCEAGNKQAWEWYRDRERQLHQAQAKLAELETRRKPDLPQIDRAVVAAALGKLGANIRDGSFRERQLILQAVVSRITLYPDRVTVAYKVPSEALGVYIDTPGLIVPNPLSVIEI